MIDHIEMMVYDVKRFCGRLTFLGWIFLMLAFAFFVCVTATIWWHTPGLFVPARIALEIAATMTLFLVIVWLS